MTVFSMGLLVPNYFEICVVVVEVKDAYRWTLVTSAIHFNFVHKIIDAFYGAYYLEGMQLLCESM
jgi:hypothetical protein